MKIFVLKNEEDQVLMEYRTHQGNRKKALFTSEKRAFEAIENYLKPYDGPYHPNRAASKYNWQVVSIGERFEPGD